MGLYFIIILDARRVLAGTLGTDQCWDPTATHISNPDFGAIFIFKGERCYNFVVYWPSSPMEGSRRLSMARLTKRQQ